MEEEYPFGRAARAGLVLLGLALAGAGLLTGFYAVAIVAGALSERLAQPWQAYALGVAILAFPALLLAAGFRCLSCRDGGELRLAAALAGAAVLDVALAVWLVRLPMQSCVARPPVARGSIKATGCIDRSWSPSRNGTYFIATG
ncbi:MAG TPA: hypothetical protein VGB04_13205 [Allosphingosinicella sp.]|jgi:hypothetical protein